MNTRKQVSVEAAAWISRLNADDRTPVVDAACQEWLAADPQHRAVFEIANRMWEDASTLPVSLAARIGRSDLTPAELAPLRGRDRVFDPPFGSFIPRGAVPPPPVAGRRVGRWAVAAGVASAVLAGALWYAQRPQVLETLTGQQLTVPLDDGSRVILNTVTRARVRFDEHVRRVELQSGEALFDVAKDPTRPFIVTAGGREIRAIGTSFVVRYDKKQTAVTLVDGKVSVSGDKGQTSPSSSRDCEKVADSDESSNACAPGPSGGSRVSAPDPSPSRGHGSLPLPSPGEGQSLPGVTVLEPGERLTFVRSARLAKIDRPAIEAVTAWRKGEIVFENTPLATAVEEMNRYSIRKLKVGAGAAADMPVSGLFRSGDAENFALALTNTHPLDAVEQGSEIEIRAR